MSNNSALLIAYESQIQEIALFAKRVNFDLETGDVTELVRQWINSTAPLYAEANRAEVCKIVKSMIDKA